MRFILLFLLSSCSAPTVSRVIDGDTFELDDGRRLRLLGVDCPESTANAKCKRSPDCEKENAAGKRAKRVVASMVGREAQLSGRKDRYGRELGRIALSDGTDLGEVLVTTHICRAYR